MAGIHRSMSKSRDKMSSFPLSSCSGSARLASLSLITPSPPLVSPPELNIPSTSLSPSFVPPSIPPSPSGISRALAPHLTLTAADDEAEDSIPEETTTPTQSKPGSPPIETKEIVQTKMKYTSQNGSSANGSYTRRKKENEPVALGDELGGDAESSIAVSSDDEYDDEDAANLNGNGLHSEMSPLLASKGSAHAINLRKKKPVSKRIVDWAGTVGKKTREVKVTTNDVVVTAQTAFNSLPAVVLGCASSFFPFYSR